MLCSGGRAYTACRRGSFLFCFVFFLVQLGLHGGNNSDSESEDGEEDNDHGTVAVGIENILRSVDTVTVDTDCTKEMDKIRNFDCKCQQRRKENSEQAVSCSQSQVSRIDLQHQTEHSIIVSRAEQFCRYCDINRYFVSP